MTRKNLGVGGNTKTPTDDEKIRKWCLTLNNYSDDEVERLLTHVTQKKWKYIIGFEVGEKCETPHLQIYIEHKNAIRWKTLKDINNRFHIEATRGSEVMNLGYCSKEFNYETSYDRDYVYECYLKWLESQGKKKEKDNEKIGERVLGKMGIKIINRRELYEQFLKESDRSIDGWQWLHDHLLENIDKPNYLKHSGET